MAIPRELLPCPLPFPDAELGEGSPVFSTSRAVQSRVRRRLACQVWTNEAVKTLNQLFYGEKAGSVGMHTSLGQRQCLNRIHSLVRDMGPPTLQLAEAFSELCGTKAGYSDLTI